MKNIVAITLTILVILLIGVLIKYFLPDDDKLIGYLPYQFEASAIYTQTFIDQREEPYTVTLGPTENESSDFQVTSMQGQYVDQEGRLAVSVIAQELENDQMEEYMNKAWERFNAPARGGVAEKHYIDGYDVYISFREIGEEDDTSQMLTLGSGYIFVPDEDMVLVYFVYNTRLYACEDIYQPSTCLFDEEKELPTVEEAKKIAQKLVSNLHDN